MRQITILFLAVVVAATAGVSAATPGNTQQGPVFGAYESVRQALLKGSIPDVASAAKGLSEAASRADQQRLAVLATELEKATTLQAARTSFAAVSDEAIRYRQTRCCNRPALAWCAMVKKSWLQPAGEIGNPYVDAGMRTCGEIKED